MKADQIEARLERIRAACTDAARKRRAAIAAEFNAAGRLNSGAYLKTVRDALISQFKDALNELAAFAAIVLPASGAASRVEKHAHDLRQMLNEVLGGEDGSRPPPGNASSELRMTFEAASRSAVATVIEDVRFSLQEQATSRKGFLQFLKRNSVVIGMAIAGGGLVVAFLALLKKWRDRDGGTRVQRRRMNSTPTRPPACQATRQARRIYSGLITMEKSLGRIGRQGNSRQAPALDMLRMVQSTIATTPKLTAPVFSIFIRCALRRSTMSAPGREANADPVGGLPHHLTAASRLIGRNGQREFLRQCRAPVREDQAGALLRYIADGAFQPAAESGFHRSGEESARSFGFSSFGHGAPR